jgi:hypothetical protein
MVTKSRGADAKKGKVKVGKLNLKKETVKNLTGSEKKNVKGGQFPTSVIATACCAKV